MNQTKIKEIIEKFTENLNKKERIQELTVIGREVEIKQLIYIPPCIMKNNPLLIGPPGVGKTAIVEGLVQKIKQEKVPDYLKNKTIYQLDLVSLRAGTKFQGELEERLKAILNYMAQPENDAILFIDEIHLIVRDQGGLDISNLLKPALSRGELQCIGATTQEEYRRYIEKDGALNRRFSKLVVPEPSPGETFRILAGLRDHLEIYYELKISDEALWATIKFSQRYLTSAYLPDKAIDLLDKTCGRVRSEMWYEPVEVEETRQKIAELEKKIVLVSQEEDDNLKEFALQRELTQQKRKLSELVEQNREEREILRELGQVKKELFQWEKEKKVYQQKVINFAKVAEIEYSHVYPLQKRVKELEEKIQQNGLFLGQKDIALTIALDLNLPVGKILEAERQKLLLNSAFLQQRIKGQDQVLRVVTDAISRARVGVQDPNRPLASFLFVGPTGVGKTEVALAVAEQLFEQKKNLVRLDMTEFSEPHSVSKLIGTSPGYIGFEEKPRLEAVREKMNSVVLFDEIEKCHPEVINLLLQILDNGFLTLANGQEVNFRNTVIILTTNLGSELYFEGKEKNELEEDLNWVLKSHFSPEFLNRLDEIIIFNSLNENDIREIIIKELEIFTQRVNQEKKITLEYNEKVVEKILQEVYPASREYGARPVKHYIEKKIASLVARLIVFGVLRPSQSASLEIEKESGEIKIITFSRLTAKQKEEKPLIKKEH